MTGTRAELAPGKESDRPAVWFLISSYHPTVGGGETHARLLARELVRRGWPITILTRQRDRAWPNVETLEGSTIRRVGPAGAPRLGKYGMLLPALFTLWRHRASIDVLYVCGLRVLGLAGVVFSLLSGRPVILRSEACGEWSGDFIFNSPHQATLRGRWLIRKLIAARNTLYLKAQRFLSISNVIRTEFVEGGVPPERIVHIPNGIDTAAFYPVPATARPALRRSLGLPESAFLFAYSGKLNRGKGLEMLIRAWARVKAERPQAHLVLIGAGGQQFLSCERELRAEAARLNLADSITFTGYVNRVPDFLRACDAFVFPSESEALGLALIEGMSCGLPALASATGGILDIIEDGRNGGLLPVGDAEAWAHAMLALMDNPARQKAWSEAGQRTAREIFSIESAASCHENMFRQLKPV